MNDFKTYLEQKRFTPKTIYSYLKGLELIKELVERQSVELDEMEYPDVLEYVNRRKTMQVSTNTINTDLKLLRHYFGYLIHIGFKSTNPAGSVVLKGAKQNHLYNILKVDQLELMYNSVEDNTAIGSRNKVLIGLLVYQGLTTGEVAKIRLSDVDLESCSVIIREQAKSNRRSLPLQSKQLLPLLKYMEQYRSEIHQQKALESKLLIISSGQGDKIKNLLSVLQKQLKKQHDFFSSWKQIRSSVICNRLTSENLRHQQHYFGFRYVSSIEEYLQHNVEELRDELDRCFVV